MFFFTAKAYSSALRVRLRPLRRRRLVARGRLGFTTRNARRVRMYLQHVIDRSLPCSPTYFISILSGLHCRRPECSSKVRVEKCAVCYLSREDSTCNKYLWVIMTFKYDTMAYTVEDVLKKAGGVLNSS